MPARNAGSGQECGRRDGLSAGWTSGQSNTGACFHKNGVVGGPGRGNQGHLTGQHLEVALGSLVTLTCWPAPESSPKGSSQAPDLCKRWLRLALPVRALPGAVSAALGVGLFKSSGPGSIPCPPSDTPSRGKAFSSIFLAPPLRSGPRPTHPPNWTVVPMTFVPGSREWY